MCTVSMGAANVIISVSVQSEGLDTEDVSGEPESQGSMILICKAKLRQAEFAGVVNRLVWQAADTQLSTSKSHSC